MFTIVRKRDPNVSCTCALCGEPIYVGEKYYALPSGEAVCDYGDCIDEWLSEYTRIAQPDY